MLLLSNYTTTVRRRERIEAAIVAGGKHTTGPHEAWIRADPFGGGYKIVVTGPHGFERVVRCALDDDPAVVAERVRETLERVRGRVVLLR